jgi:hypothetical protein
VSVPADLSAHAARLIGCPVLDVRRVGGGGNNALYRVQSAVACHALKYYPPDERDRLGTEFAALGFLHAQGERRIPAPVAVDAALRLAVYDWIDGSVPAVLDDADIDEAFAFVDRLTATSRLPAAAMLGDASAACLTPAAAHAQLEVRRARLAPALAADGALADFIAGEFDPCCMRLTAQWRRWCDATGLAADRPLPAEARQLSPSDFGRHNMLRGRDGLVFIDFEYFGWDDRVKLVSDFVLHPGSSFSPERQLAILAEAERRFAPLDGGFSDRLRALIGVFGLIWCLILLNVYLPDAWRRREAAGLTADPADARARQLLRAREFLAQLQEVLHACQFC